MNLQFVHAILFGCKTIKIKSRDNFWAIELVRAYKFTQTLRRTSRIHAIFKLRFCMFISSNEKHQTLKTSSTNVSLAGVAVLVETHERGCIARPPSQDNTGPLLYPYSPAG